MNITVKDVQLQGTTPLLCHMGSTLLWAKSPSLVWTPADFTETPTGNRVDASGTSCTVIPRDPSIDVGAANVHLATPAEVNNLISKNIDDYTFSSGSNVNNYRMVSSNTFKARIKIVDKQPDSTTKPLVATASNTSLSGYTPLISGGVVRYSNSVQYSNRVYFVVSARTQEELDAVFARYDIEITNATVDRSANPVPTVPLVLNGVVQPMPDSIPQDVEYLLVEPVEATQAVLDKWHILIE